MNYQDSNEVKQGELFPLHEIKIAQSCKECVYFYLDPVYQRCHKLDGALLRGLNPCHYFLFANDISGLLGCKDKDMEVIINNKMKEIL